LLQRRGRQIEVLSLEGRDEGLSQFRPIAHRKTDKDTPKRDFVAEGRGQECVSASQPT
jgi:hypothetical protein